MNTPATTAIANRTRGQTARQLLESTVPTSQVRGPAGSDDGMDGQQARSIALHTRVSAEFTYQGSVVPYEGVATTLREEDGAVGVTFAASPHRVYYYGGSSGSEEGRVDLRRVQGPQQPRRRDRRGAALASAERCRRWRLARRPRARAGLRRRRHLQSLAPGRRRRRRPPEVEHQEEEEGDDAERGGMNAATEMATAAASAARRHDAAAEVVSRSP